MAITAAQVKELRERTGSGMMECKKSLKEVNGDMEAAVDFLRKAGLAQADKKAGRVAAEGLIHIESSADGRSAAVVEVNCETDFVARKEEFKEFVRQVSAQVLARNPGNPEALSELPLSDNGGTTVELARKELIARIGENINVRRCVRLQSGNGIVGSYLHGTRIGVIVELEGGDETLAKDIAMHVAASKPLYVSGQDVPQDVIDKEKEIFSAQAEASGKPADIIEKMVQGRLKKHLGEITLLGQSFVKDPNTTVAKLLTDGGAKVVRFERLELGEGVEKKSENFADEVMAQVRDSKT
ncbi:MAG: translation elongation factor Ts [Gammaproteobacteria bacterium]